ncbi:MAG: hypothetical protein WAU33_16785 [Candidatus Binataceae bacterium]
MIKARGVNRVALGISDAARSSEFYGKLLGLEVVPFPPTHRERDPEWQGKE